MFRYFAVAGPVIFFASSILVGYFTQGYDYQSQMISELGATGAPLASQFNYFGFLPNGMLIVLLGLWLIKQYRKSNQSVIVPMLITIHGIGMVLATWASCDISCNPINPSPEQIAHNIIAAIKFNALHLALFIAGFSLYKNTNQKVVAAVLISFAVLACIFIGLFFQSIEARSYTGVYQRGMVICLYIGLGGIVWANHKNTRRYTRLVQSS